MIDGLTPNQLAQLRTLIRDEIAAEHREAFGIFDTPTLHHGSQCSASNSKSQQFASLDHGRLNIPPAE